MFCSTLGTDRNTKTDEFAENFQKFMLQILGLYIGFFGRFPKKMHNFPNMRERGGSKAVWNLSEN